MSKTSGKINIQVVEKVDEKNKKLASFEWQFLNYSLGPEDMDLIKEMGIETYAELECIDERAAAQTILTGRIRLEYGLPGGGFDYLEAGDLQEILKNHNGLVVLDPHRSCGWGKLRLSYYEENDLDYIKNLVQDSFNDNNFLNSVLRSAKLQKYYNFKKDFDKAFSTAFESGGKLNIVNEVHGELIELAFAYGKLKELKTQFEAEIKKMNLEHGEIRLNPDLLFDQPGHHIASGAVLNLTKRRLVRRFPLENIYEEAFFADIDHKRMKAVIDVIFSILESDHSITKEDAHDVFVVCNMKDLKQTQEILEEIKLEEIKLKTHKNIYIHVVEDDEKVKTREQILSIVR